MTGPAQVRMLAGQSRAALADLVAAHGAPRFRAAQIGDWIFRKFELEVENGDLASEPENGDNSEIITPDSDKDTSPTLF